jgi:hypothetical protein
MTGTILPGFPLWLFVLWSATRKRVEHRMLYCPPVPPVISTRDCGVFDVPPHTSECRLALRQHAHMIQLTLDAEEVSGSNPLAPTTKFNGFRAFARKSEGTERARLETIRFRRFCKLLEGAPRSGAFSVFRGFGRLQLAGAKREAEWVRASRVFASAPCR